jgi:hypothetical protein
VDRSVGFCVWVNINIKIPASARRIILGSEPTRTEMTIRIQKRFSIFDLNFSWGRFFESIDGVFSFSGSARRIILESERPAL